MEFWALDLDELRSALAVSRGYYYYCYYYYYYYPVLQVIAMELLVLDLDKLKNALVVSILYPQILLRCNQTEVIVEDLGIEGQD